MIIRDIELVKAIKNIKKFASKDVTRDYLRKVIYNDKDFVATNGKVLAVYNQQDINIDIKGIHDVYVLDDTHIFINDNDHDYTFPKYKKVFSKKIDDGIYYCHGDKKEIPRLLVKLGLPIDLSFFNILPKKIVYEVHKTKQGAVEFDGDNYKILVMPIQEE